MRLGGDYPEIKTVNDNRHLNITTSYRIGEENADSSVLTLYRGLKSQLPATLTYQQFVKNTYTKVDKLCNPYFERP